MDRRLRFVNLTIRCSIPSSVTTVKKRRKAVWAMAIRICQKSFMRLWSVAAVSFRQGEFADGFCLSGEK